MHKSEIEFENHIRTIILNQVLNKLDNYSIMNNKDVVDIIICKNGLNAKLFFLEAKFRTDIKNRIGFGNGYGKGFQIEILTDRPHYFDRNMIWVFGQENDNYFYVLKNEDAVNYVAGGFIGDKQNNFQLKLYNENHRYDEEEFINYLFNWLKE